MITAELVSQWPKLVQGTGGVTIDEDGGVVTIGFDYVDSELGEQLQQAVDSAASSATTATGSSTAAEGFADAAEGFAEDAEDAAAAAAGFFPSPLTGKTGQVIRVKKDESGLEFIPEYLVSGQSYNLLSALSASEVTDVLAGTNAIDITAKITALVSSLATSAQRVTIDARMLRGEVTLTAPLFSGVTDAPVDFLTSDVTFKYNFNSAPITLPQRLHWYGNGSTTIIPSAAITSVPEANGLGLMVDTIVQGSGRTCTGSGTSITVSNAAGIKVGTVICVFGAYRDFSNQFTLGANITSGTTSFPISGSTATTIDPGFITLRIGADEFVRGLFVSGTIDTAHTGGGRGMLGTTAASHTSGDVVLLCQSFVARVTAVSGTTLTIDRSVDFSFTNAEFRFGAVDVLLDGITIDGQDDKVTSPSSVWSCLGATLSGGFRTNNINLIGGLHGGYFFIGTHGLRCHVNLLKSNGRPATTLGASGWVFGANENTHIVVERSQTGNISNAIDDKSSGIFFYGLNLPNTKFHVVHKRIEGHVAGHNITSSSEGYCWSGYADCSGQHAIIDDGGNQNVNPRVPANACIEISSIKQTTPVVTGGSVSGTNTVIIAGKNERVIKLDLVLGSPSAIGANSDGTINFTATGAKSGDRVSIDDAGVVSAGLSLVGWTASTNTITLRFRNSTAGSLNVAAQTFKATARGDW